MNYVKKGWDVIKNNIDAINELYSFIETKDLLLNDYYYENYFGRAKNRTLMRDNPTLYKSIYHHSNLLETTMIANKRYKGYYNFKYRLKFIVEINGDIELLKCQCGNDYNWSKYCRRCPEYHKTWVGKTHTEETKKLQRLSTLKYLQKTKGQVVPRYNINSISIIEEYGKTNGYKFQHAENGGEFFIKELGYYLDAYDTEKNVVLEIDEKHHFDVNGILTKKDVDRQTQITNFLQCKFIRVKYEK